MANQSLSPISTALGLFKGVKAMLVSLPIMVSTTEAILPHSSQFAIDRPYAISQNGEEQVIDTEQLIAILTTELPKAIKLLDAVIYLMPMIATEIPESEVAEFSQTLAGVEQLVNVITAENHNVDFVQQVIVFNEKVHTMHQTLLSERYKQQADKALEPRFYQGEHSVGYRFNPTDSFDAFKNAILN